MYIYIYIYIYLYIYIYITFVYLYIYIFIYMHLSIYLYHIYFSGPTFQTLGASQDQRYWASRMHDLGCGSKVHGAWNPRISNVHWDFFGIFTWLVVWNMAFMTFHLLGISSSQLTFTHIFQRGGEKPPTIHHQETGIFHEISMGLS